MMRRLRTRIALAAAVTSALGLLAVPVFVWPGLRDRAHDHARQALLTEARLMARLVAEPMAAGPTAAALDPLVDDVAGEARARVTIVGLDGRVLADSSVSGSDLAALENHGGRPEVKEALAGRKMERSSNPLSGTCARITICRRRNTAKNGACLTTIRWSRRTTRPRARPSPRRWAWDSAGNNLGLSSTRKSLRE
jgi:hypothetical protein